MDETVFTYGSPQLKFGPGAIDEIAWDASNLGARSVAVVSDPGVADAGITQRVADVLTGGDISVDVFTGARVEPSDASLQEATDWARKNGPWDAIVAVGGGSSIDTAKAIALMTTNDGDLVDYINAPVGGGKNPTKPLVPVIAVPTTTGTGSESTTICVLDVLEANVKTGISHASLRPRLAVIDPQLTMTQPSGVTAAAGMDILCHALESYTAKPYTEFAAKRAEERVPYCGANPISDMWSREAVRLLATSFRTAVADGDDVDARGAMALAATFAGMGFGNAGVHVPHACAYPIAGMVRDFRPDGYDADHPMVPHGMAVAMTAPAAFALLYPRRPGASPRDGRVAGTGHRRQRPRPRCAARRPASPHARHRPAQRPCCTGLFAQRPAAARRRRDEAAAPARDGARRHHRDRRRTRAARLDDALVTTPLP